MKIARVVPHFLNLSETFIYSYASGFSPDEQIILCQNTRNEETFPSPWPIYTSDSQPAMDKFLGYLKNPFVPQGFLNFEAVLKKENVSLLHAHFGPTGIWAYYLARKLHLPLFVSFHGMDISRLTGPAWDFAYKKLFSYATRIFVEGPYMIERLIKRGCPREKATLLRIGIDLSRLKYRKRIWDKKTPLRILMCSRFTEKKGIPYGIKAFAQALQTEPNMHLDIIGGSSSEVTQLITSLHIQNACTVIPSVPFNKLIEYYNQAHIFLAPSITAKNGDDEGGAPTTILDAQACGLPVISSYHCDIPNIVIEGKSALLAPERDTDRLAQHIVTIAHNPVMIESMGFEGRKFVEKYHDKNIVNAELKSYYNL